MSPRQKATIQKSCKKNMFVTKNSHLDILTSWNSWNSQKQNNII